MVLGWARDVDEPLVSAHLELFASIFVDVRLRRTVMLSFPWERNGPATRWPVRMRYQ